MSRLLSGARRPSPPILRALCTQLPADEARLILVAHLREEVIRAGRNPSEITIETGNLADDLALLIDEAAIDADLRALLRDLARLIRRQRDEPDLRAVAEDSAGYGRAASDSSD